MGTVASTGQVVQAVIDARQDADAIEYAIRSIKVSRNAFGASAAHAAQIAAGCQAARRVTGRFVAQDNDTGRALRAAKKDAAVAVGVAKAAQAEIGNARQIRMALAA